MKFGFMAPAGTLEKKPKHGQPCNSCGLCCVATLCPLAQHLFKREQGPCPALSYESGKSICGVVANPMKHAMGAALRNGIEATRSAALHLIGSGTGCDARFNGEPPDESFYEKLRQWDRRTISQTKIARRIFGV